jgi:hypothetical protein
VIDCTERKHSTIVKAGLGPAIRAFQFAWLRREATPFFERLCRGMTGLAKNAEADQPGPASSIPRLLIIMSARTTTFEHDLFRAGSPAEAFKRKPGVLTRLRAGGKPVPIFRDHA